MANILNLCHWLGVRPKLYLCSLIIGFLGSTSCILTQMFEPNRAWALLSLPFMAAPFIVNHLPAFGMKKWTAELIVKSMTGSLLTFCISIVPGAALGAFLGSSFLASPLS